MQPKSRRLRMYVLDEMYLLHIMSLRERVTAAQAGGVAGVTHWLSLPIPPDLPADASVVSVHYLQDRQALGLVVHSEGFAEVPMGAQLIKVVVTEFESFKIALETAETFEPRTGEAQQAMRAIAEDGKPCTGFLADPFGSGVCRWCSQSESDHR